MSEEIVFVLVARFDAPPPDGALELLAAQPSCHRLRWVRHTDSDHSFTLVAEFPGAAGYRAALSPFDVRVLVVPWLASAAPGSGVGETLVSATAGVLVRHDPTVLH